MQSGNQPDHLEKIIYMESAVHILCPHFLIQLVYKTFFISICNSLNCIFKHDFTCMGSKIIKPVETIAFLEKAYTTSRAPAHQLTYFQAILAFFGCTDQGRFLLKRPRTSPSNRRKLIHLFFTTGFSSVNQNLTIVLAHNNRNHEGFRFTDTSL